MKWWISGLSVRWYGVFLYSQIYRREGVGTTMSTRCATHAAPKDRVTYLSHHGGGAPETTKADQTIQQELMARGNGGQFSANQTPARETRGYPRAEICLLLGKLKLWHKRLQESHPRA